MTTEMWGVCVSGAIRLTQLSYMLARQLSTELRRAYVDS